MIFNTFSITVAQRIREYGLLRTLGASRRQVLASVFVEAALIGLVGAVLGFCGGLAVREGHRVAVRCARDRPADHRHWWSQTRTVIVSVVIGIAVTLVAVAHPGPALDPGAADRGDAEPRAHRQPPPLGRHSDHRLAF